VNVTGSSFPGPRGHDVAPPPGSITSSNTFGAPSAPPRAAPQRVRPRARGRPYLDRPRYVREAQDERLGKRADHDRLLHLLRPRAEVPPDDVAGTQADLGRAAVGLDPVQEVEPVLLLREPAAHPLDRLDVASPVLVSISATWSSACMTVRPADGRLEEHLAAPVARDPQLGGAGRRLRRRLRPNRYADAPPHEASTRAAPRSSEEPEGHEPGQCLVPDQLRAHEPRRGPHCASGRRRRAGPADGCAARRAGRRRARSGGFLASSTAHAEAARCDATQVEVRGPR
jgi:hypothetical protein